MPDRVIRDELLESDRWQDLPTDTDRLAYVGMRIRSDDFGNMEAGPRRLFKFFHKFTQIKTDEAAAVTLQHLADADMIRFYTCEGREFVHLPRGRPTNSYLVRKCPPSPWCDPDIKLGKHVRSVRNQGLAKNLLVTLQERNKDVPQGVGVGVGEKLIVASSKRKRKNPSTPVPNEFEITEEMHDWAVSKGLPADRVNLETDQWLDHHKAKASRFDDWDASWRTWIRNAVKFANAR